MGFLLGLAFFRNSGFFIFPSWSITVFLEELEEDDFVYASFSFS
jgi:hypothetical protein